MPAFQMTVKDKFKKKKKKKIKQSRLWYIYFKQMSAFLELLLVYRELGYRAYRVDSADDLTKPFVSMYFGAAYLVWLSEYEGR